MFFKNQRDDSDKSLDAYSQRTRVDAPATIAWLFRDQLLAALEREIPDREDALSDGDKARRLAALATRVLDLERAEDSLIEQAVESGFEVERRADADPQAILGIAQAPAEEKAA